MPTSAKGRAWTIALAAVAAMTISYVDRQTLSVLAPTVTRELSISDTAYGFLGSGFSIAYLLAGPFAGALVDRVGARRGLVPAMAAWTATSAAHALCPGFGALFALRLVLGVVESPTFPAGVQVVQRVLPPVDRTRGMSLLFVGMSLGAIVAPPLAIGIAKRAGWQLAFVGTASIAFAWIPVWLALTSRPEARAWLDRVATRDAPRARARDVALHPAMMRGLVGLLAIVPFSTFTNDWAAKLFVSRFHLLQADLAPYLMANGIAYDAGAILFGDLASRRARRRHDDGSPPRALVGVATALACAGVVSMATVPDAHGAILCLVAAAIGRGALVTLINADNLARLPASAVAAGAGIIASAQSLGGIVANPLIGVSVQRVGYGPVLVALGAFTLPGCIAWIAWRPPEPERG